MSGSTISRAAVSPALLTREVPTKLPSKCVDTATERHAIRTDDLQTGRAIVICGLIAAAGATALAASVLGDSIALELLTAGAAATVATGLGFGAWRFYDWRFKKVDKEMVDNIDRCSLK